MDELKPQEIKLSLPKRKPMYKKVLLIIALLIIIAIAFLLAVPHLIIKDMVNMHVNSNKIYLPEDFGIIGEKVLLITEDNLKIASYKVEAKNPRGVVIFVSGIHNPSVTAFYGHAKMLQENGFGSILVEMRAHGESEGDVICLGYKEYLDVKAAVLHIENNYGDIPIIVYGLSMGGAAAINSIGEIEEIDGLISMSAYSSFEDVFYESMINMGLPIIYAKAQKPFVKLYNAFKFGYKTIGINPISEIKKLGNRPALIMHSKDDSEVSFSNFERIMDNAPKHVESFVRTGDNHFIVKDEEDFLNPQANKEYSKCVLDFLNKNF